MIYNTFHPLKHLIPILALGCTFDYPDYHLVFTQKNSPPFIVYIRSFLSLFSALFFLGGGGFKSLVFTYSVMLSTRDARS